MASQLVGSPAAVSDAQTYDEKSAVAGSGALAATLGDVVPKAPKAGSDTDIESTNDGLLHQYIEKEGKQVLISWTKTEEARVVRKADFLFLPLFSVCRRTPPFERQR